MTNQALTLQFGEYGQGLLDRSLGRFHDSANAEIDHIESLNTEISQVVVSAVDQFLVRKSLNPRLVCTPTSTQFGDDYGTIRVALIELLRTI